MSKGEGNKFVNQFSRLIVVSKSRPACAHDDIGSVGVDQTDADQVFPILSRRRFDVEFQAVARLVKGIAVNDFESGSR